MSLDVALDIIRALRMMKKNKKINKYLKKTDAIMGFPNGIQDLHVYFPQHSFAMRLFSKTKYIDIHHSNTEITKGHLEWFGTDEIAKVRLDLLK